MAAEKWSQFNTKTSVSDNNYMMGLDTSLPANQQNFKVTAANVLPYFSGFSKIIVVTGGDYLVQDSDNGALLICTDDVTRNVLFPINDNKKDGFCVTILKQNVGDVHMSVDPPGVLTGPSSITTRGSFLIVAKANDVQWDSMVSELPINATINALKVFLNDSISLPTQAASVEYVQSQLSLLAAGLSARGSCVVRTLSNLNATYNNGTSGVGATLTNAGALSSFSINSYVCSPGDRVLVMSQTSQSQNGIYEVTVAGNGSTAWVLTRTSDYDNSPSGEVVAGTYTLCENLQDSAPVSTMYVMTTQGTIILGTSNIVFSEFTLVTAGNGISLNGITVSANIDGTSLEFNSSAIRRAALTGDVTANAGSNSTTISNQAVTYSKIQNVSATDKILGRQSTGAGVVEEITCTSAGRSLIAGADASAQRTTLGLGTAATQNYTDYSGTVTFTGPFSNQTVNIYISKIGKKVSGVLNSAFAASNGVNATANAAASSVPASYVPVNSVSMPILIYASFSNQVGTITIDTDGSITVGTLGGGGLGTAGSVGFPGNFSFSYTTA